MIARNRREALGSRNVGASKINWNDTQFDGGLPITVGAAEKVLRHLWYVRDGDPVVHRCLVLHVKAEAPVEFKDSEKQVGSHSISKVSDYFAELYVAGRFAEVGWNIYFPKGPRVRFRVSKAGVDGSQLIRPVQVRASTRLPRSVI